MNSLLVHYAFHLDVLHGVFYGPVCQIVVVEARVHGLQLFDDTEGHHRDGQRADWSVSWQLLDTQTLPMRLYPTSYFLHHRYGLFLPRTDNNQKLYCIVFLNVIYISFKQEQMLLAYLIFLDSRRSSYFRHCHQIEALGEKTSLDFDCLPISCDHQGTFVRVGIPDILHQKLCACNEPNIISPVRRLLIVDHHGRNPGMSYP